MTDDRDARVPKTPPSNIAEQMARESVRSRTDMPRERMETPIAGTAALVSEVKAENKRQTATLDDIRGRVEAMERRQDSMDARMSEFVGRVTTSGETMQREISGLRTDTIVNATKMNTLVDEASEAALERAERRRARESRESREADILKVKIEHGSKRITAVIAVVGTVATAAISAMVTLLARGC